MNNVFKIAICDDDINILKQLKNLIDKFYFGKFDYQISVFDNGSDFIQSYTHAGVYDMVCIDIEIASQNGVEIINKIREFDQDVIVIFITQHSSYVSRAFRVGAFQYLQKPIVEDDLKEDLDRAINKYRIAHSLYTLRSDSALVALPFQDIYAIEVYNKKIKVLTKDRDYLEDKRDTISNKIELLKSYNFVRCHKGYIVNVSKIKIVDNAFVVLNDDKHIPLGKQYRKDVLEAYSSYILGREICL